MEKSGASQSTSGSREEGKRRSSRIRARQQSGGGESSKGEEGGKRRKLNSGRSANYVVGRNDIFVSLSANKIKFEGDEWNYHSGSVKREREVSRRVEGEHTARELGGSVETVTDSFPGGAVKMDVSDETDDQVRIIKEEVDIENDDQRRSLGDAADVPVIVDNHFSTVNDSKSQPRLEENEELKRMLKQRNVEIRKLTEKNRLLEQQLSHASGSVVTPSPHGSQAGACGNCKKKERLLQEKVDENVELRRRLEKAIASRQGTCGPSKEACKLEVTMDDIKVEKKEGLAVGYSNSTLGEQKVLLLFDEMLKVLIRQGPQVFGHKHLLRDQKSLLTSCRLVCKSWKRSVDTFLESRAPHVASNWNAGNGSLIKHSPLYTLFEGVMRYDTDQVDPRPECERISRFTELFKQRQTQDPSLNPIPTRHLEITVFSTARCNKKWTEFTQHVVDYLEAFGAQIWYMTLVARTGKMSEAKDATAMLKSISSWLQLTPNLKSLVFDVSSDSGFSGPRLERELNTNKAVFKFPHLKDLVALHAKHENLILSYMLEENRHIEKLGLTWLTFNHLTNPFMKTEFKNMTELSVEADMNMLWKLGSVSWKLRKLSASFKASCNLEGILTAVSAFRDSLQFLSLDLSNVSIYGNTVLALPCLKYLHIKYRQHGAEHLPWKNFFTELTQLEKLELEVLYEESSLRHLRVERREAFRRYIDRIREAKEWSYFPQLRNVNITGIVKLPKPDERVQSIRLREGMPTLRFDVNKVSKEKLKPFERHSGHSPQAFLRSCTRKLWFMQHFM